MCEEATTRRWPLLMVVVAPLLLAAAACTDGYVGSGDTADGRAAPDGAGELGVDGDDETSDGDTSEQSPDVRSDATGDAGPDGDTDGPQTCTPEGDGVIERSEVPLRPGLQATFRVATDITVDTSGMQQEGTRVWDYSGDYDGDHPEAVEFRPVDDQWFASEFPDADYATSLADDSDELGVFRSTEDALLLLGIVSPEDEGGTTEISYDPPVKVLDFPLQEGKTWKTETEASGTHEIWSPFVPITYDETYRNEVDARGRVETPYGRFEVLRVQTVMERTSAAAGVPLEEVRTFSFVAECFGTVATVRSESNESEKEFDQAASLRRLAK